MPRKESGLSLGDYRTAILLVALADNDHETDDSTQGNAKFRTSPEHSGKSREGLQGYAGHGRQLTRFLHPTCRPQSSRTAPGTDYKTLSRQQSGDQGDSYRAINIPIKAKGITSCLF